jgi:hypothetical protein
VEPASKACTAGNAAGYWNSMGEAGALRRPYLKPPSLYHFS